MSLNSTDLYGLDYIALYSGLPSCQHLTKRPVIQAFQKGSKMKHSGCTNHHDVNSSLLLLLLCSYYQA